MSHDAALRWLDAPDLAGSARDRSVVISQAELADAILAKLGGGGSPLDPCANSYEFVKKYGLVLDGQSIGRGLDTNYKHLRPCYEDDHRFQVYMAGAQSGKTARLMTHLTRTAINDAYGMMLGYYFPDEKLPIAFSRGRYRPFLESNPALASLLGASRAVAVAGGTRKVEGADALLTMSIGETLLFLMTIGGKTATEGLPLKGVYFDEVRRMNEDDIMRAEQRYAAQVNPINIKVSTAKYPESDIHRYFLEGDQRYFHSFCGCPEGCVLSLTFPDCVADLRKATPDLLDKAARAFELAGLPYLGFNDPEEAKQFPPAIYCCPKCGEWIPDPREGWWQEHAPDRFIHSWQMPQMLNWTQSAGSILYEYERNDDEQTFFNDKIGIPFIDRAKMPLSADQVDACVDDELTWAMHLSHAQRRRRIVNTAMGIDVQAGYGICVVKQRSPNGKHRTVHLEVLRPAEDGKTWWDRAAFLMHELDVRICLVDEAPEFSESLAFCQAFKGRAYTANLNLGDNSPLWTRWDDQLRDDDKQKGDTAVRYHVSMKRTNAIHWCVTQWAKRRREIPSLKRLIQTLPLQNEKPVFSAHLRLGTEGPAAVGLILRDHLCRFIFRNELEDLRGEGAAKADRQDKKKWVAEHVGGPNDFAIADLFASVGLERLGRPFGIREIGED